MNNTLSMSGTLEVKLSHAKKAPLSWRLRNTLRSSYIWGWLSVMLAKAFAHLTGIVVITTELRAKLLHDGRWIDYGILGRRVVTTAGVNWLVDCWQGTYEPETMRYHGCGTSSTSEVIGDTALGAECTTILNPDNTRPTGTLSEGATSNIFSSVGTATFDNTGTITEHGLFNQAATGGGTLWDRTIFTGIGVISTDTLTFTYQITFNGGS